MWKKTILLMTTLIFLSSVAVGQTAWVLTQNHNREEPSVGLTQFVLPPEQVVPTAYIIKSFDLDQDKIWPTENIIEADVAVDRFYNKAIVYINKQLWSVSLQDGSVEAKHVLGDRPFRWDEPLNGIDIIYGLNNRPKWLLCTSWTQYSYINLRTDPWTWGHDAWGIPNGGFVVDDVEFCIQDRQVGKDVVKLGLAYSVEYGGLITVWNPIEAIKRRIPQDVLYFSGTGQFGSRLFFHLSRPVRVVADGNGSRSLSGTLMGIDRTHKVKDLNHSGLPTFLSNTKGDILGVSYCPEMIDISEFVDFQPLNTPDVGIRFMDVSQQPLLRVPPGSINNLLLTSKPYTATPYIRFTINEENTYQNGSVKMINRLSTRIGWRKGIYNPNRDEFYINLSDVLPLSPLKPNMSFYIYAQWAYVPAYKTDFGYLPEITFSKPVRIPISNTQ